MATWEFQLLSRIARGNELQKVMQWGITQDDFLTNEGRSLFSAIVGYYMMPDTRGSVLGEQALRTFFPTIQLVDDPSMTTEALCVETRKQRFRLDMRSHLQQALEMVDLDPIEAATKLSLATKDLINVGYNRNVDVHFHHAFERVVERAKLVAQGYDFSIAKWMWKPLQRATMGLQYDDYVVFYGRPKSMKSWSLSAVGASLCDQNKRVLIYTKEMTPDNILQRIGCILAGVDYERFRHGKLTPAEWMAVDGIVRYLNFRAKEGMFVCLNGQDAPRNGDTVEWLDSKVDQYDPHAVLIDGMYLMSDSKGAKKKNEKVANISNDLRSLVLRRKRPVIATLQANREAAKNTEANLDEIGFTDAIGQDATLLIRVINEHKSGRPTLAMIVGGARECAIEGFRIWGRPAVDFGDFTPDGQELTGREVEQARVDDVHEMNDKKGTTKKGSLGPTESTALSNTYKEIKRQLPGPRAA
jgi:hypothetical protein